MTMNKFVNILQTPMIYVWHVTPTSNVESIKKNGLVPKIGPNSKNIGERKPAIYVFLDYASLEDAIMNWDMGWDDIELSAIKLNVPKNWVAPTFKSGNGEAIIKQKIPPNMIVGIEQI